MKKYIKLTALIITMLALACTALACKKPLDSKGTTGAEPEITIPQTYVTSSDVVLPTVEF